MEWTETVYKEILRDRGDDVKSYLESGYTYEEIFKLLYPEETLGSDAMA